MNNNTLECIWCKKQVYPSEHDFQWCKKISLIKRRIKRFLGLKL